MNNTLPPEFQPAKTWFARARRGEWELITNWVEEYIDPNDPTKYSFSEAVTPQMQRFKYDHEWVEVWLSHDEALVFSLALRALSIKFLD